MSPSSARDKAVRHIDLMIDKHGKTTTSVSLPPVHHPIIEYRRFLAPFDDGELGIETEYITTKFNTEQSNAFGAVTNALQTGEGGL